MLDVEVATAADFDALIELESALFAEDAGQHDPYADTIWPRRKGRDDFEQLMASPECVVLVARRAEKSVGLLAGYTVPSSPARQPVLYAVLRTMYVSADSRRLGAATLLTDRFLSWARDRGCVEAHVDHYAANRAAQEFYERAGFVVRSISRARAL